ncbi:MAG: hypothetical protein WD003_02600 [Candidatus Paceibacterota bacterium]
MAREKTVTRPACVADFLEATHNGDISDERVAELYLECQNTLQENMESQWIEIRNALQDTRPELFHLQQEVSRKIQRMG